MNTLRFASAVLLTACASATPAPLQDVAPVVVLPYPEAVVWTVRQGVEIATEFGTRTVPHPFTRLDVLQRDTAGLRVGCGLCDPPLTGYVAEQELIGNSVRYPLEVASWSTLPEFLLSLRYAAETRDLGALRQVMADDFSYDFFAVQTPEAAFEVWRAEQFRTLDELPFILDRGVTSPDERVWASPPQFLSDLTYHGPRAGFRRRPDGRWEWLFLIRGITH
jgi:hypothetical protein